MRILLLCSAFNGLSQRAWLELRAGGHEVTVELALSEAAIVSAVELFDPELIICPFLRERVPAEVWRRHRTIILHPGPKGDRGPSSLDWAITTGESRWGVTALQAVEEMDAGPIWGTRAIWLGATAAQERRVQRTRRRRSDRPDPRGRRQGSRPDVHARAVGSPAARRDQVVCDRRCARPTAKFSWSDATDAILRRIRSRRRIAGGPHHALRPSGLRVRRSSWPEAPGRARHDRPAPSRRRPRPHRRRRRLGRARSVPPTLPSSCRRPSPSAIASAGCRRRFSPSTSRPTRSGAASSATNAAATSGW